MRKKRSLSLAILLALLAATLAAPQPAPAQSGSIEFAARVTPTAARPEPVRQFTFYLLNKSYTEIATETEAADALPSREKFIDDLKVSRKLKDWMKTHDNTIDLGNPDIEQMLTPDDAVDIPEFLEAYYKANSGGVTRGLPKVKYSDAMKKSDPAKYDLLRQEYIANLKKFITANPNTLAGIEAYLDNVNPARQWNQMAAKHRSRMTRLTPEIAQTKYLVAKADTDLNGFGSLYNIPPGTYWLSSLDLNAEAGDRRLRWDVQVSVQPGKTTRVELTNLNGTEKSQAAP